MKTILSLFVLIALLMPFVSADSGMTTTDGMMTRDYTLTKGWNLIPFAEGVEFESMNLDSKLKAAYIWNPEKKQYYDVLADGEQMIKDNINKYGATAVWIYLTEEQNCSIRIDVNEFEASFNPTSSLPQGWNFYVLMPQMNKEYAKQNGMFLNMGTDYMQSGKVYAWSGNRWESGSFQYDIVEEVGVEDDMIGLPILFNYYAENWMPVMEKTTVSTIPAFPSN